MRAVRILMRAGIFFLLSAILGISVIHARTTLEVGYIPIIPMSQLFVMEGEGWVEDADIELKKTRFQSGPAIVQALASGNLDVAYMGIAPAMAARARGIDIRVVASNVIEQVALIARSDLADYIARAATPKEALAKFTADKGRKPKIATLPKGSVPDTVLRHWLIKVAGLSESDIDIVGMGATRVQQALLAGSIDGASILEPIISIVQQRDPAIKVVVYGSGMFENTPGAVLVVRGELVRKTPAIVQQLVAMHKKATDLIIAKPAVAAKHVHKVIGRGLISVEIVEKSVKSPYIKFASNPVDIIKATKQMHDFQAEIGTLRKPVPLEQLFDTSFYTAIKD